MIIIVIFAFLFLCFVPIGVRVIYDDKFSDIDIFLFKKLKRTFDLDKFLRSIIVDKENNKISFQVIVNDLELLINSKKIIKDIMSIITINKSTIILKQDFDNHLQFILFWNIVARYTYIIRKSFKKVDNEYYMINDGEQDISLELIFHFNMFNLVFVIIKNFKDVINIIKIKRRQRKNGTSNL